MTRARRPKRRSNAKHPGTVLVIAPLLAGTLFVMICCVTQRFCVEQLTVENRRLSNRLRELNGQIDRTERTVALLAGRDRIEKEAGEEIGLRFACVEDRVLLPQWRSAEPRGGTGPSLAASLFLSAGRGIGRAVFGREGERGE